MRNKMQAHKSRALALAFLLALAAPSADAGKSDASKESLEQLQSRIESLKQEMEHTEGAHAEVADALKQSEQAISVSNRKLYQLNQQHQENRKTLQTLQQQKSGLEQTIQEQQRRLGEQLYQQYLNGQQGYLQVVLTQRDPAAMARELYYLGYAARARARLIASLRGNLRQVAALNEQTAATLEQISELKAQQERERLALQQEKQSRKGVLDKLSAQLKAQRGEISKLKRDEKRLSDLVERLARIVPSKPKPDKSKPASPDKSRKDDAVPVFVPPANSGAFAALKGTLRLPVRGDLTNRFGAPREDSGVAWRGLFIKSREGEPVKAIADGRVVFADWLRGFGNLLIVDHGDGYMSLYGNNQALLKSVGDQVHPGDVLATVGSTGGVDESGLYYELRYQSKPFDPLGWTGLR